MATRGSKVTWRNGQDMRDLQLKLIRKGENFKKDAVEALDRSVNEGGMWTQDYLEAATTRTGRARAESGGFPGRHDSGNMIASVSAEVRNPRARRVIGVFGWWGANFEQYFRDQDLGEGNIPAARALPQAFYRAREAFRRRMLDVLSSGSWRR